jgi:trigger factor
MNPENEAVADTAAPILVNEAVEILVLEKRPGCLVKMHVRPSNAFKAICRVEAIRNVKKEVVIPGFRKGKAPEALVESRYANAIEQEWHETLIGKTINAAIRLADLHINQETFKMSKLSQKPTEDGFSCEFSFETLVEVKVPPMEDVSITIKPKVRNREGAVKIALEGVQWESAEWQNLEKEFPEEEDYIEYDLVDETGEVLSDRKRKVADFSDDEKERIKAIRIGEEVDLSDEKNNTLVLKAIVKPVFPEINDELAARYGFSDLDVLKQNIAQKFDALQADLIQEEKRRALEQYLLDNVEMELPNSLMERFTKVARSIVRNSSEADEDRYQHILSLQVNGVKLRYIIDTLLEENPSIALTEDEKNAVFYRELELAQHGQSKIFTESFMQRNPSIQEIDEQLGVRRKEALAEKLLDHLLEKVQLIVLEGEEGHIHSDACGEGCSH